MEEKNAETVAPTPPTPIKKNLVVTEKGQIALASLEDQLSFAKKLIDEKMISDTFKTPQQVVIAFQYAKALNMNELLALKMMYVVNGRPALYAEGPLSLVQRSPSFYKINEVYVDENGDEITKPKKDLKIFGSVTKLWRKGDEAPQIDWFTLDDLAKAGLDKNGYGKKKDVWDKWERIMMRYKARTMGLRSKFADSLAGIPIAEYDFHFSPEVPEIRDVGRSNANLAGELNKEYGIETKTDSEQETTKVGQE